MTVCIYDVRAYVLMHYYVCTLAFLNVCVYVYFYALYIYTHIYIYKTCVHICRQVRTYVFMYVLAMQCISLHECMHATI